jgi:hypothetical protein
MKTGPLIRKQHNEGQRHYRSAVCFTTILLASGLSVVADDSQSQTNAPAAQPAPAATTTAKPAEKGAPLPLHQIEGSGGIFSTLSAYIVNPPRDGELVGRPAVGFSYVNLGHDVNLEAFTVTESPFKRLELGYGSDHLDLGDLPLALDRALPGGYHGPSDVQLHNFNARFQVITEGEFEQKWLPAITAGVHYKYNDGIGDVRDAVTKSAGANVLGSSGLSGNDGADFTLYASKMITQLPRPVLLEAGGRATRAVWDGLAGFTSGYNFVFEGNAVVFVTSKLALAAEYKQQPDDYKAIGSLIRSESDWWTLDVAYVVNSHLTFAVGYGHFGNVLNHEANGVWGITTKWEF